MGTDKDQRWLYESDQATFEAILRGIEESFEIGSRMRACHVQLHELTNEPDQLKRILGTDSALKRFRELHQRAMEVDERLIALGFPIDPEERLRPWPYLTLTSEVDT